ncbi:P-loop containing nucleoside triphosphate hydrolase protein, partial [Baffinella frigidus]
AGGQLTEAVRRRPYSVVLLDEVEKAHPRVLNVLLQVLDEGRLTDGQGWTVLDEGRLTDGQGRTVDFSNTLLILTSNLGARHLLSDAASSVGGEGGISPEAAAAVMGDVHAFFRPELLNRLDETVMFAKLAPTHLRAIAALLLQEVADLAAREAGITLLASDAALDLMVERAYDPAFGARPLRRFVQKHVGTAVARLLVGGDASAGDTIQVDAPLGASGALGAIGAAGATGAIGSGTTGAVDAPLRFTVMRASGDEEEDATMETTS